MTELLDISVHNAILDEAPDAMLEVDDEGLIVLVNAQAERLFGYSRDERISGAVESLVPAAARAAHPQHRSDDAAAPLPRAMGAGMELAGRRKDGSEFPAEISLASIATEQGRLTAAAIRADDVALIQKPFTEHALVERVRSILVGEKP